MCKGLSKDDVGVSRDRALQVIRPEDGFKTGHFVCYKFGGGLRRLNDFILILKKKTQDNGENMELKHQLTTPWPTLHIAY